MPDFEGPSGGNASGAKMAPLPAAPAVQLTPQQDRLSVLRIAANRYAERALGFGSAPRPTLLKIKEQFDKVDTLNEQELLDLITLAKPHSTAGTMAAGTIMTPLATKPPSTASIDLRRNHALHLLLSNIQSHKNDPIEGKLLAMVADMGLTLQEVVWDARPDAGFKAASVYASGTPKPTLTIFFGPVFLALLGIIPYKQSLYKDMIPILYHEMYHLWEDHKISSRPNLLGEETKTVIGRLKGTPQEITDQDIADTAVAGAETIESEIVSELVEHTALLEMARDIRSGIFMSDGFRTVNSPADSEQEIEHLLNVIKIAFGDAQGYHLASQLLNRVSNEPWVGTNTLAMFRRKIAWVFSTQILQPIPKGNLQIAPPPLPKGGLRIP